MKNRSPLRDSLVGVSEDNDRLWLVHTPDDAYAITEYNWELTGFDPKLGQLDPKIFHYGGNAYYITGTYAEQKGWRVEVVEDRR